MLRREPSDAGTVVADEALSAATTAPKAVAGVIPGYLSHLMLDAGTPRGIPLLSPRIC
jgi:membrane-bound metal-dependent hydrolase YbcI (DUF457 family)